MVPDPAERLRRPDALAAVHLEDRLGQFLGLGILEEIAVGAGEQVFVPAKKVATFRPGKALLDMVKLPLWQ